MLKVLDFKSLSECETEEDRLISLGYNECLCKIREFMNEDDIEKMKEWLKNYEQK